MALETSTSIHKNSLQDYDGGFGVDAIGEVNVGGGNLGHLDYNNSFS